ncbi:class I SAM-dependent methyltransferase [Streptomyces sp. NPDC051940]|uniref:class I SAM-dependent methyltransferase n=1 Tax=Streptomyces sp. NPDC051940 TaxID=3155675 RepID=UPI00343CF686
MASNAGYAEQADERARGDLTWDVERARADELHLFPVEPCRVLDVGAGTGKDAAWLAGLGHTVTAVEPTDELRAHGARLYPDAGLTWIEAGLPELAGVTGEYDFVLLSAVWMHLDAVERAHGMGRLAELLAPGGRAFMTLRHGPVPAGRRMFDVSGDETAALAAEHGLRTVVNSTGHPDYTDRPGVSWTRVVLGRPAGAGAAG